MSTLDGQYTVAAHAEKNLLIAYSGTDYDAFEKLLLSDGLAVRSDSDRVVATFKTGSDAQPSPGTGGSPGGDLKPASPVAFLKECERGTSDVGDAASHVYRVCRPRASANELGIALGQALILRRQARVCERTFGRYSEHVQELDAYGGDLEAALINQGAPGQIRVAKDRDAAGEKLLGWAMEGGRTNQQYRQCEGIRMLYTLSKSQICE